MSAGEPPLDNKGRSQIAQSLTVLMREAHALCGEFGDVAGASLLETWIDETEGRAWFLAETGQRA
jgi:starvation-inducible DNA-binding protein